MSDVVMPLHEQPRPVDLEPVRSNWPHAIMLTMPSGQLLAMMLVPELSPEEVIFYAIRKYRDHSKNTAPVAFRIYPVSVEEYQQLTKGTVLQ